MTTFQEMKELSENMFELDLAAEILEDMKRDAREAQEEGQTINESIATFFAGDRLYAKTKSGRFAGQPQVVWNGVDDESGKPTFVYVRNADDPFRFVRHDGRVIEPGLMDTDGGSIPRILRGTVRFDPWGYAPSYMIHDWIFTARKCNKQPDNDLSFKDSAKILAECTKTLMETGFTDFDGNVAKFRKREDTMYLIYKAVSSSTAKRIWNDTSAPTCR